MYIVFIDFVYRNLLLIAYNRNKRSEKVSCFMISAGNLSACGRLSVYGFVRRVIYIDMNGVCTVSTV